MRRFLGVTVVALALVALAASSADAGYCGAGRYHHCKPSCCKSSCCCKMQCHTVMKKCKVVIYEDYEVTQYRTEFVEVVDTPEVPTTEFYDDKEPRRVCTTIYLPKEVECPKPCCDGCQDACKPACDQPDTCIVECPKCCLQKVQADVIRERPAMKKLESPRIVEKKIPYTIICSKPIVTYVEKPVQVCCPVPCCCQCDPCGCRSKSCCAH